MKRRRDYTRRGEGTERNGKHGRYLISCSALPADFGEVGCQAARKMKKTSMLNLHNVEAQVNVHIKWRINYIIYYLENTTLQDNPRQLKRIKHKKTTTQTLVRLYRI